MRSTGLANTQWLVLYVTYDCTECVYCKELQISVVVCVSVEMPSRLLVITGIFDSYWEILPSLKQW